MSRLSGNRLFLFIGGIVVINLMATPIETTTANAFRANRVDVKSIGACFCAVVCLSGGLSSVSSPRQTKSLFLPEVSAVSTVIPQVLVYDKGDYSVSLTGLGDAVLTAEAKLNLDTLIEIKNLGDNWNGNGALAFSESLIDRCSNLVRILKSQPCIFPTAQESIQFEWETDNGEYIEVELFENGVNVITMRTENGDWQTSEIEYAVINEYVENVFT